MLHTIRHGVPTDRPPLLIAHGLFGSARNWGVIARRLSDTREVVAVDMRNHGASHWSDDHSYAALADDLAVVIGGVRHDVLGHSMGGKAAMILALTRPDRIGRLAVADIAPVAYDHTQTHLIHAMRAVDLASVSRRSDAAAQLAAVPDDGTRSFLLQSLDVAGRRWSLNLDALEANMPSILGFPPIDAAFGGPALFLAGALSDYVRPEHREEIRRLFPAARLAKIPGAHHWLHAEKPREFEAAIRAFLDAPPPVP
jgi:pimeloyl-ACP methyl ester carboxylesterase